MDASLVSVVGSRQWLYQRLCERADPWRPHDGQHCIVECVWARDGIAHRFTRVAEWYKKFVDEIEAARADVERIAREDRQLRTTEEALRLQRLADEMARHPRDPEATNDAKREYMATQLFSQEDALSRRRIASLAALIYWWDVEPLERTTKAQRARDLYQTGESIRNIAALLKLSETKVREAVKEADES